MSLLVTLGILKKQDGWTLIETIEVFMVQRHSLLKQKKAKYFLKVTKTKVTAAYGQIIDVLFAGQKFPLGVEATRVPSGVEEAVHFDPKNPTAPEEDPNQGSLFPPGSKEEELELGALKDLADDLELKEGAGVTPTSITYHPAEEAARTMEKKDIRSVRRIFSF